MKISSVVHAIERLVELKVEERLAKGREDENSIDRKWAIEDVRDSLKEALRSDA